jgi:hypothetical protein
MNQRMKPASLLACVGLCGAAISSACGGLNDVTVQVIASSDGGSDPGDAEGGSATSGAGNAAAIGGEPGSPGGARAEGGTPAVIDGPPTVVEVSPESEAAEAEPTSSIELRFSEAVNEATVDADSFQVLEGDVPVQGTLTHDGATVTFTPATRLALLGTYTVKVTTDVEDTTGEALEQPFESTFKVRDGVWSAPHPLTETSGSFSDGYHLSIDGAGNVLAAWRQKPTGATDISVFARRYLLGQGFEDAPVLETDTTQDVTMTRTAIGRDGGAIVLWHGLGGLPPRIWARRFAKGEWEAESASVNAGLAREFRNLLVAGTEQGRAVVAWLPQYSVNPSGYSQSVTVNQAATAGAWPENGTALLSVQTFYEEEIHGLDLALSSNGDGILVFAHKADGVQRPRYARFSAQTGSWTKPALFEGTQPPVTTASPLMRVAVDEEGGAMAAWTTGSGPTARLVASRFSPTTGFSNAVTIGDPGSGDFLLSERSLVSNGKDYLLGWRQEQGTSFQPHASLYVGDAQAWTSAELIRSGGTSEAKRSSPLNVGMDARGNRLAVWAQGAPTESTLYARFDAGDASWSDAAPLVPGDVAYDVPQAVVAPNGVAAVLVRPAAQPASEPPQLLVFE